MVYTAFCHVTCVLTFMGIRVHIKPTTRKSLSTVSYPVSLGDNATRGVLQIGAAGAPLFTASGEATGGGN